MKVDKVCRLCSTTKGRLKSIFEDYGEQALSRIITDILRLELHEKDGLPKGVCRQCAGTLLKISETVERFRENDKLLRSRFPSVPDEDDGLKLESVEICSEDLTQEEEADETDPMLPEDLDDDPGHDGTDATRENNSRSKGFRARRLKRKYKPKPIDPNKPRQSDNKCYICKSDSMESAAALLDHFTTHQDQIPFTCTECVMETFVLNTVRSLNMHLRMHAQPVKCEYCDRRYSDECSRNVHVKALHLGENAPCPSTCEQCGKVCRSVRALKNHLRDHKLDLRCDQCDKVFHRAFLLRDHITHVHENSQKYICKICSHVVHSLGSYNAHLKMHTNGKTYLCDLCPMKFYTAGNLKLHQNTHAKNPNYKPKKSWTNHYTVTEDPERGKIYTCKQCGSAFLGSVNNIINHVKVHFKQQPCDRCNLKFTNQVALKRHYVVHTRERNYVCQYCGKDYLYRSHMVYHIKHKHPGMSSAAGLKIGNVQVSSILPLHEAVDGAQ